MVRTSHLRVRYRAVAAVALLAVMPATMAIDLGELWDFSRPEVSEQRFRAALATAQGDDALILQTQIARSYGLRKDFSKARALLEGLRPQFAAAGPEARARFALELGRSYASATHAADALPAADKEKARAQYREALAIAQAARLDHLAIDAVHMLAFVDSAPEDQLKWGREALAIVESSSQPAAMKWEASIRNNIGYALHQLGRYDEALVEFRRAVTLRERGNNAEATRSAHWMVAWTLRAMNRIDEALAIQLRLERECGEAGVPDPHVFEELELIYATRGDTERAAHYAELRKAQRAPGG
jgi:tetratricopeptide (TPR) repeat protein